MVTRSFAESHNTIGLLEVSYWVKHNWSKVHKIRLFAHNEPSSLTNYIFLSLTFFCMYFYQYPSQLRKFVTHIHRERFCFHIIYNISRTACVCMFFIRRSIGLWVMALEPKNKRRIYGKTRFCSLQTNELKEVQHMLQVLHRTTGRHITFRCCHYISHLPTMKE